MAQVLAHVMALANLLQGHVITAPCPGNCGCNPMCGCDGGGKLCPCKCENKCQCECKGKPTLPETEELINNPVFARVVRQFDQTRISTISDFEQLVEEIQTALNHESQATVNDSDTAV